MARPQKVHPTPYETQSGTRWKLRWHAQGRDQWEQGYTYEQALDRKAAIEKEIRHGDTPLSSRGNQKLRDFAEFHFRTAQRIGPNTRIRYRSLVKLNMNATLVYPDRDDERPLEQRRRKTICLGQMPLKKITSEVIEEWVWAVEQTRGESERAKSFRCLSSIMTRALQRKEIPAQPCRGIQGASVDPETERPSVEEDVPWRVAQALRNYTDKYGRHSRDRYAAIPLFVGYGTGNRKSEVRGLRRSDIKLGLDEARIDIKRQAYYIDAKNGWDESAKTKSKKGKRTLYIQEAALEALQQHMAVYMRPEEEDPEGNDLVFTGPRGGPISDSSWDLAWQQARLDAAVDPGLHLHDLRHHAATAVAEDTKDLKHIQEFLGDSSTKAALRYLDVTDKHRRRVGRKMGKRFKDYRQKDEASNIVPIRRGSHAR